VDFRGKSDNTIDINLSVISRRRSGNVGEGINWEGMYAYDLIQDNRVGWRIGLSSRTTIFISMRG
jgi:hypothetical protein